MRRWTSRLFACSVCAAWAASAGAATATYPVHLDYHAPAGCPDAAAFQLAISARAPEIRFENDAATLPAWVVTVARTGAGAKGELSFDGGANVRTIEGESCASVVTALSVVAALRAREAAEAPEPAPAPVASSSPSPSPPPAEASPPAPPPAAPHWSPAFGIAWLVQSARRSLGPSIFMGAERATPSVIAPSVRVGAARIVSVDSDRSFGWWLLGLEGCALRFGLTSALAAHLPCIDVESGSLASSGFSADQSRLWLAAGTSARLGVALTRALRLEATGIALVPITRDTFLSKPGEEAFRADVVLVRLAAGATLALP